MDDSLFYLKETEKYIDMIKPFDINDILLEDADENSPNFMQKAIESLKKAIKKIKDMILDAFDRIKDFAKTRGMSEEEKKLYYEIKRKAEQDSAFANLKINMPSFDKFQEVYDRALKKLDEEDKKENPSEQNVKDITEEMATELATLVNTGNKMAQRAASSITIRSALALADRDSLTAQAIQLALEKELITLEGIEKDLGKGQRAKFERKLKRYAKNGMVHRAKVKILRRKHQNLVDVMKQQINQLKAFTNIGKGGPIVNANSVMRGASKNPGLFIDTLGGRKNAGDTVADLAHSSAYLIKKQRQAKRQKDRVNHALKFYGIK